MKKRGFEVITAYQNKEIEVPKRATHQAAGYDFAAAEDMVIPSIWKQWFSRRIGAEQKIEKAIKPVLVPTGIKAYMGEEEFLQLANRSSNPLKRFLVLSNGVGVIDSDYYNNPANEGHIMAKFSVDKDLELKAGDKLCQGIFIKYGITVDDECETIRNGGMGSTNNNK